MTHEDKEFLEQLLAAFQEEARERLASLENGLVRLEKLYGQSRGDSGEARKAIETVYREVHSLKGAGRAVDLGDVESVCQVFESVLGECKRGGLEMTPELFDVLHAAVDVVGELIRAAASGGECSRPGVVKETKTLLQDVLRMGRAPAAEAPARPPRHPAEDAGPTCAAPATDREQPPPSDAFTAPERTQSAPANGSRGDAEPQLHQTVRIGAERLDGLLHMAEELLAAKIGAHAIAGELADMADSMARWRRERFEEHLARGEGVDDSCMEKWDERVAHMAGSLRRLALESHNESAELDKKVDALLEDMKTVLLQPFSVLLDQYPRMVRDLARAQGKDVDFGVSGDHVEIDRRILEMLKDPLTHLLRNALDHGLETPEDRLAAGKQRCGMVRVVVEQVDAQRVRILVVDDGRGVDHEKVREAALRRGLASAAELDAMDEGSISNLIFISDLSTSAMITDISGRGLGMAIVREKVEKAGGHVAVDSQPGMGTTCSINVPVAMSSFRGLVVSAGGREFVVPKTAVRRMVLLAAADVVRAGGHDTVELDGEPWRLVRLERILEMAEQEPETGRAQISGLLLENAGRRCIVAVESVTGEMDVMLKPLGSQMVRVRNVMGMAVLGSGRLAPVLHGPDLIKSALAGGLRKRTTEQDVQREGPVTVLVAEDSITSRMLLKNVLEGAGYRVLTAVDGAAALAQLRGETVDMVVSDVEMPRMDGFELTERIRRDPGFSKLPVVLVTSLSSREHRERGMEAGADAYIVKSSFDQSNLLETLARLR